MNSTERSIASGNSSFFRKAMPFLVAIINEEKDYLKANVRPEPANPENPTQSETALLKKWDERNARLNKAKNTYNNMPSKSANLFLSEVMERLFAKGALSGISGVTGDPWVIEQKIESIDETIIEQAVRESYAVL